MGQAFAPYFAWSTAEDVAKKPRSRAPRNIPSPLSPNAQEFSPIKPIGRPWTFPRTERHQDGRRSSPVFSNSTNLDWLAFADMPYRDNFNHSQMPIMA
jgi:hypothetical protein